MFSVYFECGDDGRDELIAELYERGTLGIVELATGVRAWFDDGVDLGGLMEQFDGDRQDEPASDADFIKQTEDSFPAFAIGERFWLAPPWNLEAAPEGRLRLEITPGMACGTGWHECTQMCLEQLEGAVTPACSVLDVGSGSGILSVAARLLGAGLVVGCDLDADAVAASRERLGAVYVGSADAAATGRFDIVVANISAEAASALESDLRRAAKPGATVIISGFERYPLAAEPRILERRNEWLCAVL